MKSIKSTVISAVALATIATFFLVGCGSDFGDDSDLLSSETPAELEGCSEYDPTYDSYAPPGCTCKSEWTSNGETICGEKCALAGDDMPWCFTTDTCNGITWSYCTEKEDEDECDTFVSDFVNYVPDSGCTCRDKWTYNGETICGGSCANPDGEGSPWCFTNETCNGMTWSYCIEGS